MEELLTGLATRTENISCWSTVLNAKCCAEGYQIDVRLVTEVERTPHSSLRLFTMDKVESG